MAQSADLVGLGLRTRPRAQFALFRKGFRPFFLLASLFAIAIVPFWVWALRSGTLAGHPMTPNYWHAHEMVFGFATGVIAGFLLTAASNWTKRETATGWPLGLLTLLWLAGRVVTSAGSAVPVPLVAVIDLLFLPALAVVLARALLGAGNRRNYVFLVLLAALWLAQLAMNLAALGVTSRWLRAGAIVGVDLVIIAILVVGGRVIPLFTRNATLKPKIESRPTLDRICIGGMALLTLLDALALDGPWLGAVAAACAVLSLTRALRWGAQHTLHEPLLWVLHLGYAFVPLGLLLRALAAFELLPPAAALHLLTTGAIGTLTLGMMTRVSLGHTGRPLVAGFWFGLAFGGVALAALLRAVGGALGGAWFMPSLYASGALWAAAFLVYLVRMTKPLLHARPDGQPG